MKKLIVLTFLISFLITNANTPNLDYKPFRSILFKPKDVFEKKKELVLLSIIEKESKGNVYAYNLREDAVGLLQLRRVYVDECNRISTCKKFKYEDRWDKQKSIEMFHIITKAKCPSYNLDTVAMIHNAGSKTKRAWDLTINYRKDLHRIHTKINKPMNVQLVDNEVIVAANTAKEVRELLAKTYEDDSYLKASKVELRKLRGDELSSYRIFSSLSYDALGRSLNEVMDDKVGNDVEIISMNNWEEV